MVAIYIATPAVRVVVPIGQWMFPKALIWCALLLAAFDISTTISSDEPEAPDFSLISSMGSQIAIRELAFMECNPFSLSDLAAV